MRIVEIIETDGTRIVIGRGSMKDIAERVDKDLTGGWDTWQVNEITTTGSGGEAGYGEGRGWRLWQRKVPA